MPKVILRCGAALTREQAANAWSEGQRNFYVFQEVLKHGIPDKKFFNIGYHAATVPLAVEIDLPHGEYVLACGYGRCKLRKQFRVDLMGVRWL